MSENLLKKRFLEARTYWIKQGKWPRVAYCSNEFFKVLGEIAPIKLYGILCLSNNIEVLGNPSSYFYMVVE